MIIAALVAPIVSGTVMDTWRVGYLIAVLIVVAGIVLGPGQHRLRFIAAISLGFLCLVVIDLAIRAVGDPFFSRRPEDRFLSVYPPLPLITRFETHVHFVGKVSGDLASAPEFRHRAEPRQIRFSTDGRGFRNSFDAAVRTTGFDVILLGDSVAAGTGTSQEATWAELLRAHKDVRLYNLGLPAASPWHEYVTLATELRNGLPVAPGCVVVWELFGGNDLDEPYHITVDLASLPWLTAFGQLNVRLGIFRDRSPIRRLTKRVLTPHAWQQNAFVGEVQLSDGTTMLAYGFYVANARRSLADLERHPNLSRFARVVNAMAVLAAQHNLRVVVVSAPSKEEVFEWAIERRPAWTRTSPTAFATIAQRHAARHGFGFVDLEPAFVQASQRGTMLWWRDDTHWNPAGHAVAAGVVYDQVIRPQRSSAAPPK